MNSTPSEDKEKPLLSHLVELRGRLTWCVALLVVAFAIAYVFSKDLYALLVEPLARAMQAAGHGEGRRLIYTNLTEAFFTYMGVALWAAFFVTAPFMLVQIWRFVEPALYKNEKSILFPYIILTPVLFFVGAFVAYQFVFPAAWGFFLSFETPNAAHGLPIQLEAKVGEYLNLSMALLLAFGFAFEIPLALVLLVHLGIISTGQLKEFRRFAIVLNFVIAAVITPPDVLSQLALAIPLCLFYELAVFIAGFLEKKRGAEEDEHVFEEK